MKCEVCSVMCDRCVIVLVLLPPGGSVLLLVELVKEKKKTSGSDSIGDKKYLKLKKK